MTCVAGAMCSRPRCAAGGARTSDMVACLRRMLVATRSSSSVITSSSVWYSAYGFCLLLNTRVLLMEGRYAGSLPKPLGAAARLDESTWLFKLTRAYSSASAARLSGRSSTASSSMTSRCSSGCALKGAMSLGSGLLRMGYVCPSCKHENVEKRATSTAGYLGLLRMVVALLEPLMP